MKRPDDINDVDGETSVRQYVCTVQSVECRCVDSVGSDAIGRESAKGIFHLQREGANMHLDHLEEIILLVRTE